MDKKLLGKKTWFFSDGHLPPPGDKEPHGHESLIILDPSAVGRMDVTQPNLACYSVVGHPAREGL